MTLHQSRDTGRTPDAARPEIANGVPDWGYSRRPWLARYAPWGLGALLLLAGLLGVDRWFYESVSLRLNTENPLDRDFYQITKPFWLLCRMYSHVAGGMVVYFALVAFHKRGLRYANAALVGVLTAALLVNVAQGAIGRLRPNTGDSQWAFAEPLEGLTQGMPSGFPSGEAATAFAMAVTLSRAWPRGGRWFYALAFLASLARVLPGMHYLTDVVVGAMTGTVLTRLFFDVGFRLHGQLEERILRLRTAVRITACPDD